ncbi:hypothetical protein P167DRAFT_125186 [Morchella conica CCBAS932]|uniref:Uncharacterized protein n=1 Tax=Morchella conica CCBAS932 TaxID=1392247 RepID=A0A3N4L690_9PEZI|nr:hypothetical protein P167DRAFT_125186 [Morchella conica CCBAS932]
MELDRWRCFMGVSSCFIRYIFDRCFREGFFSAFSFDFKGCNFSPFLFRSPFFFYEMASSLKTCHDTDSGQFYMYPVVAVIDLFGRYSPLYVLQFRVYSSFSAFYVAFSLVFLSVRVPSRR